MTAVGELAPNSRAHWDVLRPDQLAGTEQTAERITPVQNAVLSILAAKGPLTDEEIADEYRNAEVTEAIPHVTDTSIRTRRHELAVRGLVRSADEKGRSRAGRAATRWEAA